MLIGIITFCIVIGLVLQVLLNKFPIHYKDEEEPKNH